MPSLIKNITKEIVLPVGTEWWRRRGGAAYTHTVASQTDLDDLPTLQAGDTIGVQRGIVLRGRIYAPLNSAISGVLVESYGTGAPPIIDCSDIVSAGQWTANGDGTWSADVEIDGNYDHLPLTFPIGYQDGRQLVRRANKAGVVSGAAGGYWSEAGSAGADLGGNIRACEITIKPFSGDGPILGSEEFAVSVRGTAIQGPDSWTVRGIHTRRNAGPSGSIVLGRYGLIDRCVCEWGTKHNWQCEGGTVRDTICVNIADGGSGEMGTGGTYGVFYRGDATGLSAVIERCGFVQESNRVVTAGGSANAQGLLMHDNGGTPFDSYGGTQCWAVRCTNLASCSPSSDITEQGHYVFDCPSGFGHSFPQSVSIKHTMMRAANRWGRIFADCPASVSRIVENCAFFGTYEGASLMYTISGKPTLVDAQKCSIYGPNDADVAIRGIADTFRYKKNIDVSFINTLRLENVDAVLDLDNNYYYDSFNIRNSFQLGSTIYNSLADWQTATGQESNSLAGKGTGVPSSAGFSGNPVNGDFRLTAGSQPTLIDAGCDEHWDWNQRTVVSGPPSQWPKVPETLAEAIQYISDPTAWNFYP